MKKKVLAITGIRSEYDILYPVLEELQNNENFSLKLVVTGAHLSDWHGYSLKNIQDDGFEICEKIDYLLMTNRIIQRSKGVGLLICALTQSVEREDPDILLFVGDREESIATCIVGNYMGKLVAHIGGGDVVFGNADDPIRMACSKLAHIHFTTAQEYANNLKKLGEEEFRICFSGNPALNNILKTKTLSKKEIEKFLQFEISDYIVVLQHPLSSEISSAYEQMSVTIKAVSEFAREKNLQVVGIYPNTDPGSYDILRAIKENSNQNVQFFKTLPRKIFVNLMRNAKALVGNSSMGILEAPLYKLPVVNVGNRQKGRLNAGNVEFVSHNINEIKNALQKACFDENYRQFVAKLINPYGDGYAHKKIVEFLSKVDLSDKKWYVKEKLV
ncbi:flagellin modification protein PtmD, UDP-N-acetylglucosamine 2-epimerase [Campylobacter sputorum subsp. bubulus]|uniref:Flagellin modification protein PtmD, UDP-N-acetylglucosamine 2-epimerase n=1 Tax=Campylobacter sputorum subsp. sputorum TaxID=32024 RepID=A0A381DJB3_9BACT|nr:UDP-N-acetylglucosamine 2-epimerase [Campylobacter sputorum]ASM35750.1 UDP-N-acetylglucosamine 2-epimerase [Campylobacter sputorum aubsp. sputorum RM3237]KAB0581455.1 UDP-N-acetylglucosamine 2-epimerase (hydrolyzing) [Campylobacter sputorum subsp. sputorum]QEL05940.1 UDP-N-acetylglucosamine 2-epimerase [Campylobacter sputorum subsp. sputorum]SUX09035.1 flagellin modification protein PtmD, UDP-N-acetylglucosamine 2-epimerase [Campylobacter sputorum subsp. bubulus]SUX10725.1 flagellin modific